MILPEEEIRFVQLERQLNGLSRRITEAACKLRDIEQRDQSTGGIIRGVGVQIGAGIQAYSGGVQTLDLATDGTFRIGADVDDPPHTSLVVFTKDGTSYNGEDFDEGDVLFGDNTLGKMNLFLDISTGRLNFRYGSTVRAYVGADGRIYAGDGAVILDENGIAIETPTSPLDTNALTFVDAAGGNVTAAVYPYDDGADNSLIIETRRVTGTTSYLRVSSLSPSGKDATLVLEASEEFGTGPGISMLNVSGGQNKIIVNPGAYDVDFEVGTENKSLAFVVDASADAAEFNIPLTVNDKLVADVMYSGTVSLADNTATSFTPAKPNGFMELTGTTGDNSIYGVFYYNTASPLLMTALHAGANLNTTTGALTGTTGTDGMFTVSAHTDGKIYFENRRGGARNIMRYRLT